MDNIEEKNLEVSESVRVSLDTMVYWSKFLAILGYIGVGFMVLGGVIMFFLPDGMGFVGFIYLIFAVIYYYPASYLYTFATNTRHALNSNSQVLLNDGLSNLAANFKFVGVMSVVVIALYALMFVISLFGFMMF
jgi:hypothetical protein